MGAPLVRDGHVPVLNVVFAHNGPKCESESVSPPGGLGGIEIQRIFES